MEIITNISYILKDPLVQFFLWMAVLHIIGQVFVDKKISFWIASVATTFLWYKYRDPYTPAYAWGIIVGFILLGYIAKIVFHFNIFLFLKGRKRCPRCYEEAHLRAKVCPYCGHVFSEKDTVEEGD